MSGLSLQEITVQNLLLFSRASLRLSQPSTYLLGPNNAGKTSLLRLLDLAFNRDLTSDFARASDELLELLLPARETRNRARRLTLWIQIADGRRHRRFFCNDGVAQLRLSLTLSDRRFRANVGQPQRGEQHDRVAVELLEELREHNDFVHIPAGRSVDSPEFTSALKVAFTTALLQVLDRPGKGATANERRAKKLVEEDLSAIAAPAADFWSEFIGRLPAGWVAEGSASHGIDRIELASIIVEQLAVGLVTGDHDLASVDPSAVGSGLQSLLDIELRRYVAEQSGRNIILALEEPEVFLHPSAQRRLGRDLTCSAQVSKLLVSTHSPLVVEEAQFESIALVRRQQIHQTDETDPDRLEINTFLTSGRGAEMYFANSVLFVEGPGDREYWEGLRRRLASHDPSGAIDHCYVIEVGGNTHFAPWIRLLRSFPRGPINWIVIMDCDSAKELRRCATDAGIPLSSRQQQHLKLIATHWSNGDTNHALRVAAELSVLRDRESPLWLAPGDLEHIMCSGLTDAAASAIAGHVGLPSTGARGLAADLGTKCRPGHQAKNDPAKAPWIRALLAERTPGHEVSTFARDVLTAWLSQAGALRARDSVRELCMAPDGP